MVPEVAIRPCESALVVPRHLQLPLECFVEDGRQHGVEFGGNLSLAGLEAVHKQRTR